MEYTFDNIPDILEKSSLSGYSCVVEDKPLSVLQELFDKMKKEYIRARNISTELFMEDYGEEEGMQIMNNRYPKPVNIDELANQAKIIANKYEICGTTLMGKNPGFIVKIPNVRVRVRTYCNLGDYYCWIQKFGIDKFILKIYQAMPNEEGFMIFGGSSYPHPHIAGDSPCLGSFESVIKNCAGHFNMVGVLSNVKTYLNSYYGRSVFLRHSEFRPRKIDTLPIEILKKFDANSFSWDSFYSSKIGKSPNMHDKEYDKIQKDWTDNYYSKKEIIELKPHEGSFYISTFRWPSDCLPIYNKVSSKILLVSHKFDIDYYQAYALLMNHGEKLNSVAIQFDSKHLEHQEAWEEIKAICIDGQRLSFRIGFGAALTISPDDTLKNAGVEIEAFELYKLLYPSENHGIYKLIDMKCKNFWKYVDNYKDMEEFLIPQDDYDERKKEAISQIDNLYPKVMAYKNAFSRKIIITLDKHKRRLQNGLKHTQPTPESNQLSFDTVSQD